MTACIDKTCSATHCVCCSTAHLADGQQVCPTCLGRTRTELTQVPVLAAHIDADLDGTPSRSPGTPASDITSRNAELPWPGGERLSLIGPAGTRSSYPMDEKGCPPAVLGLLEAWEDDWRSVMGVRAAMVSASFTATVGWLLVNLSWAARHHPTFDAFATEVHAMHRMLQAAAGTLERPHVGAIECFDCAGVRLQRSWLAVTVNEAGERDGGLDDVWHCPACKRRYLDAEYWLAVRAAHEKVKA